jgi:hypothetical protein
MPFAMSYADQVIDALGGTSKVSELTKAPTSTVHSWRTIGIPESRLEHLKLIAEKLGIEIPQPPAEAAAA